MKYVKYVKYVPCGECDKPATSQQLYRPYAAGCDDHPPFDNNMPQVSVN